MPEASTSRDRALRAVRQFRRQFQEARKIHRGVLGHPDGSTVRVVERPDFVYVRIKALGGALWKVLNDKVSDIWNLPVLIEKVPVGDVWQVIDVDKSALLNVGSGWDGGAYLGPHAWSHEWPDRIPGPDVVDVHPRAIVPLRTYTRSYDGLYVTILPYSYTYDGVFKEFLGTTIDISTYQPASGKARYVLTYVDPRNNIAYAHPGPIRTYSAAIQLANPTMPPYAIPSAVVRVWGDQKYIAENDILDQRILLGMNVPDQAGSAVKGAPYVVMSYDGTLTAERLLTVGPGLSLTDGGPGGSAHIQFATTYAPQTPAYVTLSYHPDLPNERLLVAGANVTITDNGPNGSVEIASTGGGGGAPTDAEYVVISADATLTDERVLTVGDGLSLTDGGAGNNVEINFATTYAPQSPAYVTLSYHPDLPNERLLVAGGNVTITDNGANGSVEIAASGGYPFDVVTIDGTSTDADYATLDQAWAGMSVGDTARTGPGSYTSTTSPPNGVLLSAFSKSSSHKISGPTVSSTVYGIIISGSHLFRLYISSTPSGTNDGIGVDVTGACTMTECEVYTATEVGTGDLIGIDINSSASLDLYAGIISVAGGNSQIGIRNNGTQVNLRGLPTIDATTHLSGSGTFKGLYQDLSGNLYEINGIAGTERLVGSFLKASDGSPDPAFSVDASGNLTNPGGGVIDLTGTADALVFDDDGDTTMSAPTDDQVDFEVGGSDVAQLIPGGFAANTFAFTVKNTSGATVAANDVGYIDEAGEFKTTTTEWDIVSWCVVLVGGANNADIYVAKRGRVTVELDQNCSAGDYLYTSTTAGRATSETYVRPELFAVALTANSSGAGGTCEALLLCERTEFPLQTDTRLYNSGTDHATSDFVATMNGDASGTSVVYNTPSSGDENWLDPDGTITLASYMILHNSTKVEEAYISDINTGTNTITVTSSGDVSGWQSGDTITVRSPTVTGTPSGAYFADFELKDTSTVHALAVSVMVAHTFRDTTLVPAKMVTHIWDTWADGKEVSTTNAVANVVMRGGGEIPIVNRRWAMAVNGTVVRGDATRFQSQTLATP